MYWTLELASKLEDAPWPATKDELRKLRMNDTYTKASKISGRTIQVRTTSFLMKMNTKKRGRFSRDQPLFIY
jgi:hypothetical protein